MNDDRAWVALNAALADETANRVRIEVCRTIGDALKSIAAWLTIDAGLRQDRNRLGLGLITEMGCELTTATVTLYDTGAYYAGMVLVRQLIEVGYLLAWFADDPERPGLWLSTPESEQWATFRPQKMRKVLRASGRQFRVQEYTSHCELGGHPNPRGSALIVGYHRPGHDLRLGESQWLDLAQHLEPLWIDELNCLARLDNFPRVRSASIAVAKVTEVLKRWHAADPLAGRFDEALIEAWSTPEALNPEA